MSLNTFVTFFKKNMSHANRVSASFMNFCDITKFWVQHVQPLIVSGKVYFVTYVTLFFNSIYI